MLCAFFLKAVYDLPTTKGLIENLNTNPSLRRLCDREYRGDVPSEATFSGAFGIFAREKVFDAVHAAGLSSASLHDSQAAIPLMQMSSERATILYDLADSVYDAEEITTSSEKLGHVSVIDPNPGQDGAMELVPARKVLYQERSTVERGNSNLKDNYGARHIRVKGHWKLLCHLMFGVIAITVTPLFNMFE